MRLEYLSGNGDSAVFTVTAEGKSTQYTIPDKKYKIIQVTGSVNISVPGAGQADFSNDDTCLCTRQYGASSFYLQRMVIKGPVVAHFFGMFDWYDDPRMIDKTNGIIARCDFSKMNMLIVAWCEATNGTATYIRDAAKTKAIYKQIIDTARAKNPDIVILLASNFGNNGVVKPAGASASSASAFASQLKNLITDNGFDGFCLDYESDDANETQMTNFCEAIKTAMPDKILAISPAPVNGLTVDNITYYDYVLPQTYDHGGFTNWQLGGDLENKIGKNHVLLGRNIEGKITPDDPDEIGGMVKGKEPLKDGYGGVFDWRVDQDTRTGH